MSSFNNDYKACLREIDFKRGNPYIFLSEDYEELMNNKAFFARKFDFNKDKNIIDKIYQKILEE